MRAPIYISLTYLPPMQEPRKGSKGFLFKGGTGDNKTAGETALIFFKDRLRASSNDVLSSQSARGAPPGTPRRLETMGGNGVDPVANLAVCAPVA